MEARRTRGVGTAHDQRRREIADGVLAVVADRGLAAVSLTEVAARANVSAGRVQHYFPTKQALMEAAFERGNELATARIAAASEQSETGRSPRETLTAVLTDLVPRDATTVVHLRVRQWFTALALSDARIAARLRADYAWLHGTLADLLRTDQADGLIPAHVDPEDAAVRLVALTEGLAYYVLVEVTAPARAREAVLAAIADLYPAARRDLC
ncbi:TetR/AcrR family transcriptional regulator [Pseudonocardia acaciae]|uniref:TetR/AcrR family transcriptional regulator n=1 Tax=Pseudonocardia acaciae TaxID=551276 RepID=UPI000491BABD|nr:TetR/AcrR family transcriptional regulator [Pseudonocardia acaciae]